MVIQGSWRDYLRFIYNRGSDAERVHFLTEVLNLTDPAQIRRMPGFKRPGLSRVTFMTYELRSREIRERIESLLDEGFNVRVISDPSTFTLLTQPSKAVWASWSKHQRQYFLNSYDDNHDGTVSDDELSKENRRRYLANGFWDQLKKLKEKHRNQLELISAPLEVVPTEERYPYPRLTHFKKYSVEFKERDGWISQVSMVSSANLTDTCLDKRVSNAQENLDRYLEGDAAVRRARGSQGHVQFGAIVRGKELHEILDVVPNAWVELYKRGLHFDSLVLSETQLPRMIFNDGTGHHTSLQAFFSEGLKTNDIRSPIDPIEAIGNLISPADIKLKVFYSAQFVATHTTLAWNLRHHLASGNVEDFGLFVDGGFAVEPYSTLPNLLFAPKIDNRMGVSPGRAIQEILAADPELDPLSKTFVYEGDRGIFGGPGDKLHSKATYLEFEDGEGVRHYAIAWGSANQSNNAGRQNADGLFLLTTTDPSLGEAVRPFFAALRRDERMRPYTTSYLQRRFLELFSPKDEYLNASSFEAWAKFLSNPPRPQNRKTKLRSLVRNLENAGALNAHGENLLSIFAWMHTHMKRELSWNEFFIALVVADPSKTFQPAFYEDLKTRWLEGTQGRAAGRALNALLSGLSRKPIPIMLPESKHYRAVLEHLCEGYLKRLGITVPGVETAKGKKGR